MRDNGKRICNIDIGLKQRFPRQIESPDAGILVDIAQDIRKLERAAEMMRERATLLVIHAEDTHG